MGRVPITRSPVCLQTRTLSCLLPACVHRSSSYQTPRHPAIPDHAQKCTGPEPETSRGPAPVSSEIKEALGTSSSSSTPYRSREPVGGSRSVSENVGAAPGDSDECETRDASSGAPTDQDESQASMKTLFTIEIKESRGAVQGASGATPRLVTSSAGQRAGRTSHVTRLCTLTCAKMISGV